MAEPEKPSNQEEPQKVETTTTATTQETPAANDGQFSGLLTSELDGLEKLVVDKLSSDETKTTIESKVINPVLSLAHGFAKTAKGLVSKAEAKVERTLNSDQLSSLLHKKQPKGTTEEADSLPTSDVHVGESSQVATDQDYVKVPEPKIHPLNDGTDNAEQGDLVQAPRSNENQPLVGVTLPTRNSWMNCCGLLEVFVRPSDH